MFDSARETTMCWPGFGCFSLLMEVRYTSDSGFWNKMEEVELVEANPTIECRR